MARPSSQSRDCTRPEDLLGSIEAAALFDVKPETLYAWRSRRHAVPFPAPWLVLSGNPLWQRKALEEWGRATDRLDPEGRPTRKVNAHPPVRGPG